MIRDARAVEFWVKRYEFWMSGGMMDKFGGAFTDRDARSYADAEVKHFAARFCEPEEQVAIEETLGRVGGENNSTTATGQKEPV